MNIAFFLTPKSEVVWIPLRSTMRQALERMEYRRYSAVPLLDDDGCYVGPITEGDLLWKMKNTPGLTFEETERIPLAAVPRRLEYRSVDVTTDIKQLLGLAVDQNFVPVVDSRAVFMGIVRRKAIIEYSMDLVARSG